jgi:hypothetical protein
MEAQEIADVAALVRSGYLDLDAVFESSRWWVEDHITTYTACVYGDDGDEPGEVEIVLESASSHGITAYRWAERDDSGTYEYGPITLDRAAAEKDGKTYADEHDEEPDAEDLISRIVDTGYFGVSTADDIRAVCEEATGRSRGYMLLPAGRLGLPVDRVWTENGYLLDCEYVTLDAQDSVAFAADALLRAVLSSDAEGQQHEHEREDDED